MFSCLMPCCGKIRELKQMFYCFFQAQESDSEERKNGNRKEEGDNDEIADDSDN